jgi:hypothetical protein
VGGLLRLVAWGGSESLENQTLVTTDYHQMPSWSKAGLVSGRVFKGKLSYGIFRFEAWAPYLLLCLSLTAVINPSDWALKYGVPVGRFWSMGVIRQYRF